MEGRLATVHRRGPQLREVVLDGERVRCLEQGSGPPVVLIHGFASSGGLSFGRLFPELPDGYRFVAVELAGLGWSDRRCHRPLDPRSQAERLLRVLGELEVDRAVVVGTSLGGAIAQHLALLAPDRVQQLVLLSALDASKPAPLRVWALAPLIATVLVAARLPRVGPLIRLRVARPPSGFDEWWTPAHALEATEFVLMPGTVRAAFKVILDSARAPSADISSIAVPTLVVSGENDTTIPPRVGAGIAARIARARHMTLAGSGHCLAIEQPRAIADCLASVLAGNETGVRTSMAAYSRPGVSALNSPSPAQSGEGAGGEGGARRV